MIQDRREKRHLGDVGEPQHDRPRARGRIERLAFEQFLLKMLQVRACGANDRMRTRSRDDPARSANEERVIECLAKTSQRVAHCGLAHAQPSRRTTDTQLVVERNRDRQQIEIESLRSQYARQRELVTVCDMSLSAQLDRVNVEYPLSEFGITYSTSN
jgi:hypothetical protein